MAESDEFAEFDTDGATFEAMLEQAEPAELVDPPADVTQASTARDTIRVPPGIPISLPASTLTVAGRRIRESRARRPPAVRHARPTMEVAG